MHRPALKKRLGQHHLVDGRLCRPLVEFLQPAGRRVLEIGPGGGVLTAELLGAGAKVLALELDLEWACALRRRFPALALAAADATRLDGARLRAPTLVAGNLPFNVATHLIEQLLPWGERVPRAAFMVQKEVAERLVAAPGEPAYGSFSVIVAAWARTAPLGTVRPGSFRPPPKVAAGLVGFELHEPPLARTEMPAFTTLVRVAFAQRRKTLRNALAAAWGKERAEAVLAEAGLDPGARAETLALTDFLALYRVAGGRGEAPDR